MPKGGKRAGAGRKRGTLGKKTSAIAAAVAESGKSPLEAMVDGMRYHYDKAQTASDQITLDADTGQVIAAPKAYHFREMLEFARYAAPFVHPRLNAVEHTGKDGGPMLHTITREERADEMAAMLDLVRKRRALTARN